MKAKKYIAHAGIHLNGRIAAQNSLGSIRAAVTLGFDFVELDVRFTSDSIPVACHDDTLNATFVGFGGERLTEPVYVAEHTFAELRNNYRLRLDAPDSIELIPTLAECAELCRELGIMLMVHPKIATTEAVEEIMSVCDTIIGQRGYYIVSEREAVDRVLEIDPEMPVMAICDSKDEIAHYAAYKNCIIALRWYLPDYAELVAEAHRLDCEVETTLNHDIRCELAADVINYDYLAARVDGEHFTRDLILSEAYTSPEQLTGVAELSFFLKGSGEISVCGRKFEVSSFDGESYRALVVLGKQNCSVAFSGDIEKVHLRLAPLEL